MSYFSSVPFLRRMLMVGLGFVLVLTLAAGGAGLLLRASLPRLDGRLRSPRLKQAVEIDRDALGVPSIHAHDLADAFHALGFLHAQERFFQMDLLRRKSAGELAELFGGAALPADREARIHGFRTRAREVLAALPAEHRALLSAYADGVNAGISALTARPWEYLVLRTKPAPWQAEDSLLTVYTVWLDLQDEQGRYERTLGALYQVWGEQAGRTLSPRGDSHDAALDGSTFPEGDLPPALPLHVPAQPVPDPISPAPVPGSNAFAVSGPHTATGSALLASDFHLGLSVPNVWYRVALHFTDRTGAKRRVVGVTMPGIPSVAAGSNGRVAWGMTNAYVDTIDVVKLELMPGSPLRYRTPGGWESFTERKEMIRVKGRPPEPFTTRWTRWGPVMPVPEPGLALASRWSAHDVSAQNLAMLDLLDANSVAEAIAIAHRVGMPNQNLLVADRAGRIAWTVIGRIPVRSGGYDGLLPAAWGQGTKTWTGWLAESDIPTIIDPPEGLLWSANNRSVGGDALGRLGDNGYDHGFRAQAIRDKLRGLATSRSTGLVPADLQAVQLDDEAPFLEPWRQIMLQALASTHEPYLLEIGEQILAWSGRADPGSAGYRLIRDFRLQVTERVMAPYFAEPTRIYRRFNSSKLHTEDLVLRLLRERPGDRLDPGYANWDALLAASLAAVAEKARQAGARAADYTWGRQNRLEMRHPLSRFLPRFFAAWVDMPSESLPGDVDLPRNQTPRHGQSERLVVSPGREEEGIFQMPGGQSGHPLSPYYRAGHTAWLRGASAPLLPGATVHKLQLTPGS